MLDAWVAEKALQASQVPNKQVLEFVTLSFTKLLT
jgi:hypothetical protein